MNRGSFLRGGAGRGAAAHVGRSLTRRIFARRIFMYLKQGWFCPRRIFWQMNEGCTYPVHVGLSIFSFQVVLFTSGIFPPHSPPRLSRPGLPNQLIRAAKAAAKRTYFYQKSCLLPHFFAAFGSFSDFLFKTATERWPSPQNCCALGPRAFFYI